MNLKSVVAIAALNAAIKTLGIKLTSKTLPIAMAIKLGYFLKDFHTEDDVTTTESTVLAFFKTLTDNPAVADLAAKTFSKVLSESPSVTDTEVLDFYKNLSDGVGAADTFSLVHSVVHSDTVFATDDVDGAASILDDQEMQFFKNTTNLAAFTDSFARTVAFSRNFAENPSFTDTIASIYGTTFLETPSLTDAGSLRSQGYCDFTFFAEDFVGASRTF